MKSPLVFHRVPTMKLVDALKETSHMIDGELTKEIEFTLPFKVWDQMFDLRKSLKSSLLDIAESDQPMDIRAEAALQLDGLKGDELVRRVGNLLLTTKPTKDRQEMLFRDSLGRALATSRHPSSLYYAIAAKKKGVIRNYEFREILANCKNPEAIPLLYDLAKTSKPAEVASVLVAMQAQSPADGLKLANEYASSPDPAIQFQVLRTRAELADSEQARNKCVKKLYDLFANVNWLKQCDIAKTFGKAQTPLAYRCLKKISGKGSDPAVQQWIDGAIQNYKKL